MRKKKPTKEQIEQFNNLINPFFSKIDNDTNLTRSEKVEKKYKLLETINNKIENFIRKQKLDKLNKL